MKTFLNNESTCIVCFKGPEHWENGTDIQLIKHHIRYYPEVIAYVHFDCHNKIHDPDKPLTNFIQYTREESISFYEQIQREKKIGQAS